MGRLHLALLGTPQVRHSERILAFATRKALALLIYLVTKESLHSREKLTALLWPESDEEHGRMALRRTLALLRQSLDEGSESPGGMHLLIERETLSFNFASDFDLDLHRLSTASALLRSQTRPSAEQGTDLQNKLRRYLVSTLQQAVDVYQGEFLEGFSLGDAADFDNWIDVQRAYWQRQMEGIFNRLSQVQFEGGEIENAITTTTHWVTRDPLNEAACRRLMRLHIAVGDRYSSLEAYETCRALLKQELQTEPAAETKALAARIQAKPAAESRRSHGSSRSIFAEAPLIGRTTEHTRLVTTYRKLRREGPQMLTLVGEAGIGKTRLVSEFLRWATVQGADVLQGRAFETGGRLPYHPLVEALRDRIERENAPDNLLNDVWLAELSRILPELRDRYPDLPPLLTLGEAEARTRFFEAVALLCQTLSEQAPLVLFFDDLQWIDVASLDMLHYAARRWVENGAPILLLLSVRSEQLATTPLLADWLAGLGRDLPLTRLVLQPLTAENTVQLVHAFGIGEQESGSEEANIMSPQYVLPLGERFGQWLFAETGGQPFFIMETLKALVEQEILTIRLRDNRKWVVTLDETAYVESTLHAFLPPGVREVVRARLARLSRPASGLLAAGAILGQNFTFENLCQVAEIGEMEGLTALDEVLTSSLLLESERGEGRSSEQTYFFAHDKIRDVVYTEAGDARRRILHRHALEVLQTAAAPPAELAHHARASRLSEPTFRLSVLAGDAAAQLFALAEAHLHYTHALEALSHLPGTETNARQRVDTIIKLVKVSWIADDPQRNLMRLAEAEALAQNLPNPNDGSGGDRQRLARVHFWISQVQVTRNAMGEAMRYLQQVLLEAQEVGDEELLAMTSVQMGRAMISRGQFSKSKPLFAQAATLLEKAASWPDWIFATSFLGIAFAATGYYTAGVVEGEHALGRAQETNTHTGIALSHVCLSTICLLGGEIERTLEESRTTVEVAEQSGNRFMTYLGYGFRGWAESRLGRHEAAMKSMMQSQAISQSLGGQLLVADWLAAAHAEIVLAAGRIEEALALAEKAVNIARSVSGLFAEGLAERVWGQALAALDSTRWNEAEEHLVASLEALEACEAIPEAARTQLAWGLLCRDRKDPMAALARIEAAAAQFESVGLTCELEKTRVESLSLGIQQSIE